jgi:peptidoglycan/LPS O-acetylase OafA/YrhL
MAVSALSFTNAQPRPAVARDAALDFTKGTLVLFMVLYHWLNYFVGVEGQYYNYLRFLTPSFIFITGFMISQIHFQKYGTESLDLPGRLTVRGLKLLAVFVSLNVLIGLALPSSLVRRSFVGDLLASSLVSVFASGNITNYGGEKTAAFMILVPIAYLLIVSAGLTLLYRRVKYVFHYAFSLLLLWIFLLSRHGMHSFNLELLMIGVLGVVFGYAKREQIAALVSRPFVICAVYCVYLGAITIWDVTLPVQTIGAVLTTTLIYIAGKSGGEPGMIRGRAILLGKYSLVGYISQIAILQVLRRFPWFSEQGVMVLLVSLLLGFVLTVVVVELLDWARGKSRMVNRSYQLVFA